MDRGCEVSEINFQETFLTDSAENGIFILGRGERVDCGHRFWEIAKRCVDHLIENGFSLDAAENPIVFRDSFNSAFREAVAELEKYFDRLLKFLEEDPLPSSTTIDTPFGLTNVRVIYESAELSLLVRATEKVVHEMGETLRYSDDIYALCALLVTQKAAMYAWTNDDCARILDAALEARAFADAMEVGSGVVFSAAESLSQAKTALARKAANKAHQETRSARASVERWYDQNKDKFSTDEAAATAAMNARLVPYTYRTYRAWISERRKQLQAAS